MPSMGSKKPDILKIKDLKTTNMDSNKQDIRYGTDSKGQDNNQLPLWSLKLQITILTLCIAE